MHYPFNLSEHCKKKKKGAYVKQKAFELKKNDILCIL